jgi:hypothetical protein
VREETYTCTFRIFKLALGACGIENAEMAMMTATTDAIEVK